MWVKIEEIERSSSMEEFTNVNHCSQIELTEELDRTSACVLESTPYGEFMDFTLGRPRMRWLLCHLLSV